MEAVIAEPPAPDFRDRYIPQVHIDEDVVIVIVHWAVLKDGLSNALLQCRRTNLLNLLLCNGFEAGAVITVREAFKQMNSLLEGLVGKEGNSWRVERNSMVVIICGADVHVFGRIPAVAFLCRNSKDIILSRPYTEVLDKREDNSKPTYFGYYHRETLTRDDSHLIVGAAHIRAHCDQHFTPILQTRINVLGLEDACAQIAGRSPDFPRVFVCVPLAERYKLEHIQEPLPAAEWGTIGPCKPDESDSDTDDDDQDQYEVVWPGLKPLNGEEIVQIPAPRTACGSGVPRDACIRRFDFGLGQVVCKYCSCTIIVTSRGRVAVRDGLFLVPRFTDELSGKHTVEAFRSSLTDALARDISTEVSFPLRFEGDPWAEECLRVALELVADSPFGSDAKNTKRVANVKTVYLVADDPREWRALIGITDLLATWDDELEYREYERAGKL